MQVRTCNPSLDASRVNISLARLHEFSKRGMMQKPQNYKIGNQYCSSIGLLCRLEKQFDHYWILRESRR